MPGSSSKRSVWFFSVLQKILQTFNTWRLLSSKKIERRYQQLWSKLASFAQSKWEGPCSIQGPSSSLSFFVLSILLSIISPFFIHNPLYFIFFCPNKSKGECLTTFLFQLKKNRKKAKSWDQMSLPPSPRNNGITRFVFSSLPSEGPSLDISRC